MTEPFEWNPQAFGGTEYMARNFKELILPSVPKLRDYLSLIVPGVVPVFENIIKQPKDVIVWVHNTPEQFAPAYFYALKNPKFLEKVKYFIAVSEFSKKEIMRQLEVSSDKVYVIPNAIHPLKYSAEKFESLSKVKLINTSSPDRGIDVLLNSIAFIDEDFELEIFSKFNPDEFDGYVPDPRIKFYGFSPKSTVKKHYEAAHIHAYPSTYPETFCISQAEAMSAGLLCVTPDIGALPEVSGNKTTIYSYTEDREKHTEIFAKHITDAIRKVKNGEWHPETQIEYINKTYSWDAIKDKWLEFHELI